MLYLNTEDLRMEIRKINDYLNIEIYENLQILLEERIIYKDGETLGSDLIEILDTKSMENLYNILGEIIEKRKILENENK